jgi:hypothetical protein
MAVISVGQSRRPNGADHPPLPGALGQSSPWLLGIAVLVLLFCYVVATAAVITAIDGVLRTGELNDFIHYWSGAGSVAAGHSPYEWLAENRPQSLSDYGYPPLLALLLAPVTRVLDYSTARWAWLGFSALCLVLGWALAWTTSGLHRRWRSVYAWLPFFALLPWAAQALTLGQLSPQLLLVVVAAFAALGTRRPGTAGALVVIGACLKTFPGLLGGYLLLRRQWRAGLVALATGLVLLAGMLLVLGWEPLWAYLTGVIPAQRYWFGGLSNRVTFTGFFTHLLIPNPFTTPVTPAEVLGQGLIAATTLALLAATGHGIWRARRDWDGDALAYALAVVAMLLVSPLSGPYNLIIAFLPLAVAAARIQTTDAYRRGWLVAAMILLFLPLRSVPLILTSDWESALRWVPLFGLLALWSLLLRLCLESSRASRH